ncbi:acetyl-CoA transporter [Tremella mesenterica]|uniref:Acetyl-CoA transporter n=1 Tax=Tremella mesenterica TaxID=5217 RepID=A0A4V1M4I4_TREME|nr:acetyl-CoA transporter [Tremella mesenterica]
MVSTRNRQPELPLPSGNGQSTSLSSPSLTRRQKSSRASESTSTPRVDDLTSISPLSVVETQSASSSSSKTSTFSLLDLEVDGSEGEDGMYGSGLRGRNIEDLGDVEEKGLLKRSDSSNSNRSEKTGSLKGKERERSLGVLEKVDIEQDAQKGGLSSKRDKQAFALLVLLYLLQGIPLGLTFGTIPFLLKPHLSYSQLAIFALSTWPYSLKLLWSPIVDAWFLPKWGRRKSWIVPVQAIVGVGLWIIGSRVEGWLEEEPVNVKFLTTVFGSLILAAATQDIAVDGWALTLLSPPNLSYASTAQTIGLGIGNALSFTVFLAFNSPDFSNRYFRSKPLDAGLVSLGGYMKFWGLIYALVTVWLARFKREDPVGEDDPDMDVRKVYKVMWSIVQLPNIQSFLLVHLICKFGFMVNDSVTPLKLLEKGLSREDLAVAVLLDFPAQMIAGWLAAKWSRPSPPSRHPLSGSQGGGNHVLRPWVYAFWARLGMAGIATLVVRGFPTGGKVGSGYFGLIVLTTLLSSQSSTVQFVGITAFHTQIADPLIGGTYMTLLNTVSNLGGTWPKPLILRSVDLLSSSICRLPGSSPTPLGCTTDHDKSSCIAKGGECVVYRDGYYIMSVICVSLGAAVFVGFILPTVRRLEGLPLSSWRVRIPR